MRQNSLGDEGKGARGSKRGSLLAFGAFGAFALAGLACGSGSTYLGATRPTGGAAGDGAGGVGGAGSGSSSGAASADGGVVAGTGGVSADGGLVTGAGGVSVDGGTGSAAGGSGGGSGLAGSGGSGGSGAASGGSGGSTPPGPSVLELTSPALDVQGGTALSPGGQGRPGGIVHVLAIGDVSFDPSQAPVVTPSVPSPPATAAPVTSAALAADFTAPGDVVIGASVTSGGSDAVRKITVGGDLYLSGSLRAADLGTGRQELDLTAGGTIYLSGTLDASGAAGTGQAGGPVRLSGNQIVLTGALTSAGGASATAGGAAGAVTIQATKTIAVTGKVDLLGGDASGAGAVTGGAAAGLSLQAGGDIGVSAVVRLRGGAAGSGAAGPAQGGAAATLTVNSNGALSLGGIVDARGGAASAAAAGGTVLGGSAGAIRVGESAPGTSAAILVPVIASGGAGDAAAGGGGTITPEPGTGNVNIAGPLELDLRGGDSMTAPGVGGLLDGGGRTDPGSGGVHVSGEIVASGGSILMGGTGNGADGGRVDLELTPTDGAVLIDQSAKITVEGGTSGGTGTAGGGGHVWFFTKDGDETIAGMVDARGGDARDLGGVGGGGGMIYFLSDNNYNAVEVCLGNLWVTATGVLDASGGLGTMGGNGRSDGKAGPVPAFPDDQEEIAIFLNCDAEHGNTCNWMKNDGQLIARGGVHDGSGGDVVYHGIPPGVLGTPGPDSGDYPVPPGMVDNAGDGTGMHGDFDGE